MGILFLTYLGNFEAKQAMVVPRGEKTTVVLSVARSQESSVTSVSSVAASESSASSEESQAIESSASSVVTSSAPVPASKKAVKTIPTTLRPAATESSASSVQASASVASEASSTSSSSAPADIGIPDFLSSSVQSSAVTASSSSAAATKEAPVQDFPAFDHTSFPVGKVPNWGAMTSPSEWNRTYAQMTAADYVSIPRYDMSKLTIPMSSLTNPVTPDNVPIVTAKLFYSTRYLGMYDLDAGEGTGKHAGVDLKLPRGTPIGAIAGGRVSSVTTTPTLGLHVIIEHRLKNGETYYSIYAHFDKATVSVGQDVKPGQQVGNVGMTGNTSGPHLHLQVDRGTPGGNHTPFVEGGNAATGMVNPITFIGLHRNGE